MAAPDEQGLSRRRVGLAACVALAWALGSVGCASPPGDGAGVSWTAETAGARRAFRAGRLDPAAEAWERALVAARQDDAEGAHVAEALVRLAEIDLARGRVGIARQRLERALAIRERAAGFESTEVVEVLRLLGAEATLRGTFDEARGHYERALRVAEVATPGDHPERARLLGDLGLFAAYHLSYAEAEAYLVESLAMWNRLPTASPWDVIEARWALGRLYLEIGQPERAEPYLDRTRSALELVAGAGGPVRAALRADLAAVRLAQGRLDEALALCQEARSLLEESVGGDDPRIAAVALRQARIRILQGRNDLAEAHLARAVAALRASDAPQPVLLGEIAAIHSLLGREGPVTELFDETLARWEATAEDPQVFVVGLIQTARSYRDAGLYDEARLLYRRARGILGRVADPNPSLSAFLLTGLAEIEDLRADPGEAERLYGEALSLLEAAHGDDDDRLVSALLALGEFYLRHFRGPEAAAVAARALEIRERRGGQAPILLLEPLWLRARSHMQQYRWADAERDQARTDAILRGVPEPSPVLVSYAEQVLAEIRLGQARDEEAIALLESALDRLRQHLGTRHALVARAFSRLGRANHASGRMDAAEAGLRTSLQIARTLPAHDTREVATDLFVLCDVYREQGRLEEARELLKFLLAYVQSSFGEGDPRVAVVHEYLGLDHQARGNHEAAIAEFRRSIGLFEDSLGPDAWDLVRLLANLVQSFASLGRYDEASATLERAIRIARGFDGMGSEELASAASAMSLVLLRRGEFDEAAELGAEANRMRILAAGIHHPGFRGGGRALADSHGRLERLDEAGRLYLEDLEAVAEALGRDDPATGEMYLGLARTSYARGAVGEAGTAVEIALPILRESYGPRDVRVGTGLMVLGGVHVSRGAFEEGESAWVEGLAILREHDVPVDPIYGGGFSTLARHYFQGHQFQKAEIAFQLALQAFEKSSPPQDVLVGTAIADLGAIYVSTGRPGKAVHAFRRALEILEPELGELNPIVAQTKQNLQIAERRLERSRRRRLRGRGAADGG